jgi:transcription elongation GreA/GreB family factor
VENPTNDRFLQIGHIASLEFDDGEEREYEIAGFGESDLNATPQKIEYLAPIVRNFVGKEVDTTAKINIGGKVREITLIEISRKEA